MHQNSIKSRGFNVFSSIEDVSEMNFDCISMFHVFEHFKDPLQKLAQLYKMINRNGSLIIEVPQANDVLLKIYNCKNFKAHTFWSEHLILHTKRTLFKFLRTTGFKIKSFQFVQRYPISNHLYWLLHGKPNGHSHWKKLNRNFICKAYQYFLSITSHTDTLIAIATK